jgi:hypothetical protein
VPLDGTIIFTFNSKSTGFTVKCENYCPVECSDGCCKTIAACETVIERNSTCFTVKCENYCPVGCSDGCCKTIAAQTAIVLQQPSEHSTEQEFSHLTVKPVEFLSITVSQAAIVCCKTIAACETVVDRNSTGFTVKCENYFPSSAPTAVVRQFAACETVVDRNPTGFTHSTRRDNNSHI